MTEPSQLSQMGERIRILRKASGLSQLTFSNLIGLQQSTVSKIETGDIGLGIEHLAFMTLYHRWNPVYILTGMGALFLDDMDLNIYKDDSKKTMREIARNLEILLKSLEKH